MMAARGKMRQDNSAQADQENGRHTEDRNVIQADNKQEPDVRSEPSEEPERKELIRSDVQSITKAPNSEEKRSEEDPMECGEVMEDDTNTTVVIPQPPPENKEAKEWDETQKEGEWQTLGNEEKDRDGTKQNERTTPPTGSPKKRKKMKTENNGERKTVRERSVTRNIPQQRINKTTSPTQRDGHNKNRNFKHGLISRTKLAMLDEFLRRQEIDILDLEDVTHPIFDTPRG
jgi:hypothetical protein